MKNLICKLYFEMMMTSFDYNIVFFGWKSHASEKVLLKANPRNPANWRWIEVFASHAASNPTHPVQIRLWISIPAAIWKYCYVTLGRFIPWCFVTLGFPSNWVKQKEINCFSFKSLNNSAIILLTPYLLYHLQHSTLHIQSSPFTQ